MTKKRLQKTDGLGPHEIKRIRSAVRQVWQYSYARALVIKRCTDKQGYTKCEKCKKRTPKLKVDHIQNVGDVDSGFIERMFVPSSQLQGLCKICHNQKTKWERQQLREKELRKQKLKSEWERQQLRKQKLKDFF